jgi:hypothetical protein
MLHPARADPDLRGEVLTRSVRRLAWNFTPNTATRLLEITTTSRNEMNMAVHDRLSSHLAAVHAVLSVASTSDRA